MNPKEKSGFHFNLTAFQGKATNNIKAYTIARDLLEVLGNSKKAIELMALNTYEFSLDKQFVLHVKRHENVVTEVTVEATNEEVKVEG